MRVRIFHTADLASAYDTDGPGTGLREVFSYDEPDPTTASTGRVDHLAILERVFFLFNVGDDPAFGTPDPVAVAYRGHRLRSLSVGDVVALDDTFYACASVGWLRLDTPPEIAGSADGDPPIYDVAAYAGASPLKITTRDLEHIRRHVRRHMPAFHYEVPETWYARLDGYLDEALRSGRVEFERYAGATYVITARVVAPHNPGPTTEPASPHGDHDQPGMGGDAVPG